MSFTPTEQAILIDLLIWGDDRAANIANRTGFHRNSVSRSAKSLIESGHISNKGEGVYQMTDSGIDAARGLIMSGVNPYTTDD
jgi:predicted transcriptional regulator